MATNFVELDAAEEFLDGFFIVWSERPPDFPPQPLVPIIDYDSALSVYDFGDMRVTIVVPGHKVQCTACDPNLLVGAFTQGDSVLTGATDASAMPIHLRFDPPVRGIGTRIAALGNAGDDFIATLNAHNAVSGEWMHRSASATIDRNDGTAPFVGLRCKGAERIDEAWFDVISPNGSTLDAVAINQLYFLPA